MKKQRKFLFGGAAVIGLVGYLMWTGISDAAVYYHTPAELLVKVADDPSYRDNGLKVGGRVADGSVTYDPRTLELQFDVIDIENPEVSFPVTYQGPLPETFKESADVVVEGVFAESGVFEATTVLTKCGSRYEAAEDDYFDTAQPVQS